MGSSDKSQTVRNFLVPSVSAVSADDLEKVLAEYNVSKEQLPRILITDSGLKGLDVNGGDVVKFERKSWVTGKQVTYFRMVAD
jgi:DNA-directed RNA polymerase subunit H (RpoH/RPB5)